ncbi:hypothetical protein D3C76_1394770 [compost metagenome]
MQHSPGSVNDLDQTYAVGSELYPVHVPAVLDLEGHTRDIIRKQIIIGVLVLKR